MSSQFAPWWIRTWLLETRLIVTNRKAGIGSKVHPAWKAGNMSKPRVLPSGVCRHMGHTYTDFTLWDGNRKIHKLKP